MKTNAMKSNADFSTKFSTLFAVFFVLISHCPAQAKHLQVESEYVSQHCAGIQEYALDDKTRVDCLSDYAEEWDFAGKFYECLTQSLHYAMKTGKPAKCVLIQVVQPAVQ